MTVAERPKEITSQLVDNKIRETLFDSGIDFRVLSGSDQPLAVLLREHERSRTMPWIGRACVAEQFH